MKIAIGADHAAFEIKSEILEYLKAKKNEMIDEGTYSIESCDYPDFAEKVACKVRDKIVNRGILICGTGIGMSIAANKIRGIRAALCLNVKMAEMSRLHNDANVLCLGARILAKDEMFKIIDKWLGTDYEGGRHDRRLEKIKKLEGAC